MVNGWEMAVNAGLFAPYCPSVLDSAKKRMAELVPAIHVFDRISRSDVDAGDKRWHDE